VARHADALAGTDAVLGTVLRAVQLGLAAMLVTGVLLDTAVGGAYHSTGWFRASGVLFLAIAAAVGFARIAFRRSGAPGVTRRDALARVERWGWVASVLVALVTIVMRTKPLA
jgi:hypothetical protein